MTVPEKHRDVLLAITFVAVTTTTVSAVFAVTSSGSALRKGPSESLQETSHADLLAARCPRGVTDVIIHVVNIFLVGIVMTSPRAVYIPVGVCITLNSA